MFRSLPKSLVFVATLTLLAVGLKPLDAATYHIGSGTTGAYYYDTLDDLRQATYWGSGQEMQDGDRVVLYANDSSLTDQLYIGENVSITIASSDPSQRRTISSNPGAQTRFVYMDGSSWGSGGPHLWSKLYLEGIEEISGFDDRGNTDLGDDGGGVIYAWWNQYIFTQDGQGTIFKDNFSSGYMGGGAVYYWDAIECDFRNSSFIDNKTTGLGGALFINASQTLYMEDHTDVTIGASDGRVSTFSGNLDRVNLALLPRESVRDTLTGNWLDPQTGETVGIMDPLTKNILNPANLEQIIAYANSIDFTGEAGNTANLFVETEGTGILDMQDPFRTNVGYGSYYVNIIKTGEGTWKLGGHSVTAGSSGAVIEIREGTLFLYEGAQLNATGTNDEFNVFANAQVFISGDNTITGTRVLFQPASNLVFDFDYYSGTGGDPATPMLNLSGDTLVVQGTRIDVANVPFGEVPPDRYALIQGTSPLTVGDFDLWVGNVLVNDVSERYGYRLDYDDLMYQLLLEVGDTYNSVLTWQNHTGNNLWEFGNANKNWDVADYKEPTDSFIPGDAVVFSLDGDHTVTLGTSMPFSARGTEPGMRITGSGNWTFTGGSFSDLYNSGVFDDKGTLEHAGTGTVTLQTSLPSTYHGGTVISGGGELVASRGDQLGDGGISFKGNGSNRLTFNGTTTLAQQLTVGNGDRGTLTAASETTLTVTVSDSPAVHVEAGGTLTLRGTIRFVDNQEALTIDGTIDANGTRFENNEDVAVRLGNGGTFDGNSLRFSGNTTNTSGAALLQMVNSTVNIRNSVFTDNEADDHGGAVFVSAGNFTANGTRFEANKAQHGGALAMTGGAVNLRDSNFLNNTASTSGGAIYYEAGSSLTLGATTGRTSTFSGNTDSVGANSVVFSGAANIQIATDDNGVLDMRDPMRGQAGFITKSGTGTWNLGGDSVFTGTTQFNINAGKLELYEDATIEMGTGTFTIGAGGAFVAQGGNEVTANTINLFNGATLGFDLTGYEPEDTPLLDLVATLPWNTNGWRQNIDVMSFDGLQNDKDYNLMTVSAGAGLNANNMKLLYHGEDVAAMRTMEGELKADGSMLKVAINSGLTPVNGITRWTNNNDTGNGEWNATSMNWAGTVGGEKDLTNTKQFYHGDAVVFDGTGAGTVTINAGGVIIASQGDDNPGMWITGGNNYTFSGGPIGGDGGLLKEGTGTVTFANENKFTGGTTILGGTIVAQTVKSLGTGDINTGNATDNGTIEFNLDASNSGVYGYKIDGDGNLVKSGDGDLTLNNTDNDYDGTTTILGGRLIATDVQAIGQGDIITGVGENKGAMVFDLEDKDDTIGQIISGTGDLVKSGSKTLTLIGDNKYTGKTIIEEGRLVVPSLDILGNSSIVNHAELEFCLNDKDETLGRSIDGIGAVIKSGTQKLSITDELALQNNTLTLVGGTFGFGTLDRATLGGLAGKKNLDLKNDRGHPVALTVGYNDQDAEYSGILSGEDASLTKIGTGTQTLSGKNTYNGGTLVKEGRLVAVGLDALGDGSVKTDAELELRVSGHEELDYAITGTGSVDKSGSGTLEVIVGQKYTGDTIVSEGTLKVGAFDILGTGSVSVRSGGTLLVDVAKDMELASNVSVAGNLTKTGSGTLTITGNPSLAGTMNIDGGGLVVNGTTHAATIMGAGTILAGSGRIDNTVTLKDGARQYVSLPNATVQNTFTARNFVYEGGSTVYIKVGQYDSDRIIAEEGFVFAPDGGKVRVVFLSLDDFVEEQVLHFDVFAAKGGVIKGGENILFDTDDKLAFIGYEVKNGEKQRTLAVDLLATGGNSYSYLTENQRKVLGAASSYTVLDRFFNTTEEYRGGLINELTPSLQTAIPYVSQRAITQYNLATFERLRFLREPLALDAEQETDYRGSSYQLMHRHGRQNYIWFQNFGDFLRTQADAHCPGLYADGYGFSIGVDRGVDVHTVVGVGLGGYFAKARTADALQSAKANSFLLSAYGMRTTTDDWMLSTSGGFSFNRYSIDRNAPSFGSSFHSGHNGTAVYAAAELTRKFMWDKLEVSPYLDVNWICLWEEGATERANGDPSLALRIKSQNTCSFLVTPGVRFGRSFRMLEKNIVNPSAYLGWVQDWGAGRIRTTAAFPGEPNFTIRGASMRNNRAVVGLNLNMTLSNRADLFARFHSELAENYSDISMHWGIRLGF